MIAPVGTLMNTAAAKAAKAKSGVATETAPCGCRVEVHHLSPGCQTIETDRCTEHAWPRGAGHKKESHA